MNDAQVTEPAMNIPRSGANFHWSVITVFVLVVYVYYNEIEKKNWNVICTPFMFDAEALPASDREKIREACQRGDVSLYGTGIDPGRVGTVLPVAMSGMSRRMDRATIFEKANWSFSDDARITFDKLRFGSEPEEATLESNGYVRFVSSIFQEQIYMLAAAWGVVVDEVVTEQELIVAENSFDIISGHLPMARRIL